MTSLSVPALVRARGNATVTARLLALAVSDDFAVSLDGVCAFLGGERVIRRKGMSKAVKERKREREKGDERKRDREREKSDERKREREREKSDERKREKEREKGFERMNEINE